MKQATNPFAPVPLWRKRLMRVKVVKLEDTTALGFGRAFRRW